MRAPAPGAVGEMGLDPVQDFGLVWPPEDQARCLRAQLEAAKAADVIQRVGFDNANAVSGLGL